MDNYEEDKYINQVISFMAGYFHGERSLKLQYVPHNCIIHSVYIIVHVPLCMPSCVRSYVSVLFQYLTKILDAFRL